MRQGDFETAFPMGILISVILMLLAIGLVMNFVFGTNSQISIKAANESVQLFMANVEDGCTTKGTEPQTDREFEFYSGIAGIGEHTGGGLLVILRDGRRFTVNSTFCGAVYICMPGSSGASCSTDGEISRQAIDYDVFYRRSGGGLEATIDVIE